MSKNKNKTIRKNLYTLFIDYDGATFIAQAKSKSLAKAPSKCIEKWNTEDISSIFSDTDKLEILAQLENEMFVEINGLSNIWCGSVLLNNKLMLLNLVLTKNGT